MAMFNNQRVIGFHETFHGIGWILESENLSRRWKSVVNLASWMWKKTWYPKSIGASDGIIMKSIFIQTVMLLSLFIKKSISRFRFKKKWNLLKLHKYLWVSLIKHGLLFSTISDDTQKPTIFKSVAKRPLLTKRSLRFTAFVDLGENPWETASPLQSYGYGSIPIDRLL